MITSFSHAKVTLAETILSVTQKRNKQLSIKILNFAKPLLTTFLASLPRLIAVLSHVWTDMTFSVISYHQIQIYTLSLFCSILRKRFWKIFVKAFLFYLKKPI